MFDNQYIALQNPIVIKESSVADFANAGTLIFTLSSNFAFEPVADARSIITDGLISGSNDDIAITAAVINSSTITITYTNDGNASGIDRITIGTGLKIKYTGSDVTAFGTLTRTGGTAQINGVSNGFNILDLEVESVDPLTTITSGSPTDGQVLLVDLDICKGGLFDTNYSSLANATANFSIKVDPDPHQVMLLQIQSNGIVVLIPMPHQLPKYYIQPLSMVVEMQQLVLEI